MNRLYKVILKPSNSFDKRKTTIYVEAESKKDIKNIVNGLYINHDILNIYYLGYGININMVT